MVKITGKIPGIDPNRHRYLLDTGWKKVEELKGMGWMILLSIPFMILNCLVTVSIIQFLSPDPFYSSGMDLSSISIEINLLTVLGLILLLLIHESLHLVFIPNFMRSDRTYIGITIFGGFVYSEETISRCRYMMISMAPFVVISIVLPVILSITVGFNDLHQILVMLNSIASSVDVLGALIILKRVPLGSRITFNGSTTYWKI